MKCPRCGRIFSPVEAEKTFNEHYAGKIDYDELFEERLCLCGECAIEIVENGFDGKQKETSNEVEETSLEEAIDTDKAVTLLDAVYRKALDGIPFVSRSVTDLANDYLKHNKSRHRAAKSLIRNQIAKCGTSGFITGLGGLVSRIVRKKFPLSPR